MISLNQATLTHQLGRGRNRTRLVRSRCLLCPNEGTWTTTMARSEKCQTQTSRRLIRSRFDRVSSINEKDPGRGLLTFMSCSDDLAGRLGLEHHWFAVEGIRTLARFGSGLLE